MCIASSPKSRSGRTAACVRPVRSRRRRRGWLFADSLAPSDEVAIEATCNTHAIAKLLEGRVARVVISNPQKTRAIAEAAADLFGHKGRRWLAEQTLPADEGQAVGALLRQLDFHAQELAIIDAELGRIALGSAEVRRLMTISGVDATVALSIVAAVGDFARFRSPQKLVSYLGLNPRVRQSGGQPASHGRITKQGRAHARGMLVEAAWAASKTPGPLRAFYQRVRSRRGMQVAVVATARKLAVLCWHLITKGEDYAFARPSLTAQKLRRLELRAGMPSKRGQKGNAAGYSLKAVRARENALNEQAEQAYRQLVADWQAKAPKRESGVAAANGARLSRPSNGATAARQDSAPDPALRSGVDHAHSAA